VIHGAADVLTIVMEYADDGDLQGKIVQARNTRRPLAEDLILYWTAQVVLALHHLHQNGIIHRDIKTANLFLTKAGLVKVGDFGVSRQFEEGEDPELARCKTPVGTPMYMAPEICSGGKYGQKADMWALGCALFEMMTLQPPFVASSYRELASKVKSLQVSRKLPPYYSDQLRGLATELMSVDPDKRPSSSQLRNHPLLQKYFDQLLSEPESGVSSSATCVVEDGDSIMVYPSRPAEKDEEIVQDFHSPQLPRRSLGNIRGPAGFNRSSENPLPKSHLSTAQAIPSGYASGGPGPQVRRASVASVSSNGSASPMMPRHSLASIHSLHPHQSGSSIQRASSFQSAQNAAMSNQLASAQSHPVLLDADPNAPVDRKPVAPLNRAPSNPQLDPTRVKPQVPLLKFPMLQQPSISAPHGLPLPQEPSLARSMDSLVHDKPVSPRAPSNAYHDPRQAWQSQPRKPSASTIDPFQAQQVDHRRPSVPLLEVPRADLAPMPQRVGEVQYSGIRRASEAGLATPPYVRPTQSEPGVRVTELSYSEIMKERRESRRGSLAPLVHPSGLAHAVSHQALPVASSPVESPGTAMTNAPTQLPHRHRRSGSLDLSAMNAINDVSGLPTVGPRKQLPRLSRPF
jgi:serine/threonine protein kinase